MVRCQRVGIWGVESVGDVLGVGSGYCFFHAVVGIRGLVRSGGLGGVYGRQGVWCVVCGVWCVVCGVWCGVWCVVWCVVCVVCVCVFMICVCRRRDRPRVTEYVYQLSHTVFD